MRNPIFWNAAVLITEGHTKHSCIAVMIAEEELHTDGSATALYEYSDGPMDQHLDTGGALHPSVPADVKEAHRLNYLLLTYYSGGANL